MDNKYNWEYYTAKEKIAYREFLKGNKELISEHNIIKDCTLEISFALSIAKIFFNINPRGKALDVGCGSGFMTQCFSKLGFDALGFDITKEAIEVAKSNFPGIGFFIGDGTKPKTYLSFQSFDIIHIREFHPFKVINDFDFQIKVINDYLDILSNKGIIIITQARSGFYKYSGELKKYECLNYNLLKTYLNAKTGILSAGPFHFFLLKHLRIIPINKITIKLASLITRVLQMLTKQNWVEFFLIYKSLY